MLPSPFDNVHGGASAVTHIPSSMQQSSADGDKAAGTAMFLRVHACIKSLQLQCGFSPVDMPAILLRARHLGTERP